MNLRHLATTIGALAVLGALALAAIEWIVALLAYLETPWGGGFPVGLAVAAFGEHFATHALWWFPVSIPLGLLIARLRSGERSRGAGAALGGSVLAGISFFVFLGSPFFDAGTFAPDPPSARAERSDRPHVLWVVLDTARADRMNIHGAREATTPFLAELARSSRVFDAAAADGTWTAPSHASMFTGLSVRGHGVGRTTPVLSHQFETTAQRLTEAGWRTASFSNNPLISHPSGLARGFEDVFLPTQLRLLGNSMAEQWVIRQGFTPVVPWLDPDQGAALTADRVARWLDAEAGQGEPLFVFVNLTEAHLPWELPEPHRRAFLDAEESARSRALRYSVHGDIQDALNRRVARDGTSFLAAEDADILRKQYDATIRYLDGRVAELVALFEAAGLWEDTLFVLTSDHGEYLGTHDLWSHLYRTYQDLTHVAMLIRPPGGTTGTTSDVPVLLSDLHATVLAATTGAAPGAGTGRDLLADPSALAERPIVSEAGPIGARAAVGARGFREAETPRGRKLARPEIALRDARYKLVWPEGGSPELYDLQNDPGETRNLLGRRPAVARRMQQELRRYLAEEPAYAPGAEEMLDPDSGLGQALKALGYIED